MFHLKMGWRSVDISHVIPLKYFSIMFYMIFEININDIKLVKLKKFGKKKIEILSVLMII